MPEPSGNGQRVQTGYLAEPMGMVGIVLFGLYFVVVSVGGVYLLWTVWPDGDPAYLFGRLLAFSPGTELRLILVALLSGGLGSFVHAGTSFATYLGNRQLKRSWAWWYLLRPFIGMVLALIFYFLVRGGFLTPGADASSVSPYGVAAVAGLVGLFSKQASDKLKDVFEQIFPTDADEARGDDLKIEGAGSGGRE